jgi:hypothetical protein
MGVESKFEISVIFSIKPVQTPPCVKSRSPRGLAIALRVWDAIPLALMEKYIKEGILHWMGRWVDG